MITPPRPAAANDVAAHYDELDAFYRDVWGEHVHHGLWRRGDETVEEAVEKLIGEVTHRAHIDNGQAVCDAGCGYGATARLLARQHGAQVTALTLSEAQCTYARSVAPHASNPVYQRRDWLENRLPEAAFDAVLFIESTAHMDDKIKAFAEAFRVLKPGGRLVVCAWLAAEAPRPWHVRHLLQPICREGRLSGLGTETEYRAWLTSAGFSVDHFDDLTRQVQRTWPICLRRTAARLLTHPRYARYLLDRTKGQRIFLVTMARIWLAYRTGVMRYGLFAASKPAAG